MLFTALILSASENINKERSVASIYHLFTGAKNIQTQQDAHIFNIQDYYGIYKSLKKNEFDRKINELVQNRLVNVETDDNGRQIITPTKEGLSSLDVYQKTVVLPSFKGMLYHDIDDIFYRRLLLFIQTLSNIKENHFSFIPVITDKAAESFVKHHYQQMKGNEIEILNKLYQDLQAILERTPDELASIFVDRLSGYRYYGKSIAQLSSTYRKETHEIHLLLSCAVHTLLHKIITDKNTYQVLPLFVNDLQQKIKLTDSARKTHELFKQGYSINRIAEIRRLKMNTVYDHMTEIALNDTTFPFERFVPEQRALMILQAIKEAGTSKLKAIKDQVPPDITYFQIRLMLIYHHRERGKEPIVSNRGIRR